MLGHGGSSAGSYLADPTSPIPSPLCCHYPVSKYCSVSIVVTSTVRVKVDGSSECESRRQILDLETVGLFPSITNIGTANFMNAQKTPTC